MNQKEKRMSSEGIEFYDDDEDEGVVVAAVITMAAFIGITLILIAGLIYAE